jgi:hypothetical protein
MGGGDFHKDWASETQLVAITETEGEWSVASDWL